MDDISLFYDRCVDSFYKFISIIRHNLILYKLIDFYYLEILKKQKTRLFNLA